MVRILAGISCREQSVQRLRICWRRLLHWLPLPCTRQVRASLVGHFPMARSSESLVLSEGCVYSTAGASRCLAHTRLAEGTRLAASAACVSRPCMTWASSRCSRQSAFRRRMEQMGPGQPWEKQGRTQGLLYAGWTLAATRQPWPLGGPGWAVNGPSQRGFR